jgi:putative pyruvate formate lyase activating enzyme
MREMKRAGKAFCDVVSANARSSHSQARSLSLGFCYIVHSNYSFPLLRVSYSKRCGVLAFSSVGVTAFRICREPKMLGNSLTRPAVPAACRNAFAMRNRYLHLAPPFLLDDYIPRYHLLSSIDAARKRSLAYAHLRNCNLCPRLCGVNRYEKTGHCLIGAETVKVNVIAPHFGEEPCIQGHNGSGSVFFSGCNLRCVFCQNHDIAHQRKGFDLTPEELADWMLKLQEVGCVHNINFITPEHVVPQVALSILHARELGLKIPIVYNTSAFDSLESLELMDGLVDIYLPDFKIWKDTTSKRLLKADNYTDTAMESIKAMYKQVGDLSFTADGIAKKGLLVRHLVMPGKEDEGVEIVRWLANNVSKDTFVNIMEQYHPDAHVGKKKRVTSQQVATDADVRYADINRATTDTEVGKIIKAARDAGLWRFAEAAKHGGFNI